MRITRLQAQNFRTLESITVDFPSYYTALSGRNDSGKTNVLRAIRALLPPPPRYVLPVAREDISLKDDFPKWKDAKGQQITLALTLSVTRAQDEGLHRFVTDYLQIAPAPDELIIHLAATYGDPSAKRILHLKVNDTDFPDRQADELLSKLRSSSSILIYNSTNPFEEYGFRASFESYLGDIAGGDSTQLEDLKGKVNKGLKKIATKHQKDLGGLLGRLKDKYRVGLSIPTFGFEYLPLSVTLGDKGIEVDLEEWGSGTRNRTLVLLTLFRARKISEAPGSAAKTTPILVIEEPESFLHPSAQAEFGKVLQELAEEFAVQVIVSTHSPYMLSQARPEANILLERAVEANQFRATRLVNTGGSDWMTPFGLSLGIDNAEFAPWREVFFGHGPALLLVEGDIDREYFELLRDKVHGDDALSFEGEIFPYGGKDQLQNTALLRFIKSRYKRVFVTYDLDAEAEALRSLTALGMQKHKDFCSIGRDDGGPRAIEGLVPDAILTDVYSKNTQLVQEALHGTKEQQRSGRQRIKRLTLDTFKRIAKPGPDFARFYKVAREINKALG